MNSSLQVRVKLVAFTFSQPEYTNESCTVHSTISLVAYLLHREHGRCMYWNKMIHQCRMHSVCPICGLKQQQQDKTDSISIGQAENVLGT